VRPYFISHHLHPPPHPPQLAQIKQLLQEEITSLREVERRSAEILQQAKELSAKGQSLMNR
jgi:hypothetical protein